MSRTITMPAPTRWRQHAAELSRRVWQGLESLGQARAAAELRRTADRVASADPELAARMRAMARGEA